MIPRFVPRFSLRALGLLTVLLAASASASTATGEWRFRVFLDDAEIGYHHFRLRGDGPEQQLESEARYNVKFLYVTVYTTRTTAVSAGKAAASNRSTPAPRTTARRWQCAAHRTVAGSSSAAHVVRRLSRLAS
jgi:hypothetical protein